MSLAGKEVLIIDDMSDVRFLARKILENLGFVVAEASSVDEAHVCLTKSSPHLFIVDLQMPGKSGFNFLEERRASPALSGIPALVVSGKNDKESIYKAITLGASDYLLKPFSAAILVQKVRKIMRDQDFHVFSFEKGKGPQVTLSANAQIANVRETSFLLGCPIRLEKRQRVGVTSPALTKIGLDGCIYVTDSKVGVKGASGLYFSEIHATGLSQIITRKVKKT